MIPFKAGTASVSMITPITQDQYSNISYQKFSEVQRHLRKLPHNRSQFYAPFLVFGFFYLHYLPFFLPRQILVIIL